MKFNKRIKHISVSLILVAILMSILFSPVFSDDYSDGTNRELDEQIEYLKNIIRTIQSQYVHEVDTEQLIEGAIKGMFDQLDQYSNYYNTEEFSELFESVSGDYSGIGAYISKEEEYITIVTPIEGSPAQEAGLKSGDKLLTVDGTDIKGFTTDQAINLIKGESGTSVRLGVKRERESEILYFDITRAVIEINPVSYKVIEGDIGYIRVTQFNSHTVDNMNKALNFMDEKGVDKLVIDLRNNPGGYLDQVIDMLKNFVPNKSPIVHINYGKDNVQTYTSTLEEQKYEVAVLVNEGSASASEIFAGAIQDTDAGKIIGTTSYGKGTVQTMYAQYLDSGRAGMKITVAEYLTPKMRSINGKGIIPDIIVENSLPETKIDLEDIGDFRKKGKFCLNDVSLDVLTAEQILTILGYEINEPDGVMDEISFEAIKDFQGSRGLFSYGVLDFTTQDSLDKALEDYLIENTEDKQLNTAIDFLKGNN